MLINQLNFLNLNVFTVPEAHAQNSAVSPNNTKPDQSKLNLVAILVEDSLLNDKKNYKTEGGNSTLKEYIMAYADNVQKRLPHTKAFVIGVKPDESTYKISTVLEKLYFEGFDSDLLDANRFNNDQNPEDDNHLAGVVLVGQVPIPVVNEENETTLPSLYPYTDFYRKQYIYDHERQQFEKNQEALNPNPEVWHGVIVAPTKNDDNKRRQELANYFDKNNQYSNGKNGYDEFDQRLFYADFPAIEEKLNKTDYQNYQRSIKYAEEVAFQRFNKHFLKEVVQEISLETGQSALIDDQSIGLMADSTTRLVVQKFMKPLASAFQIYIGQINEKMETTGRWGAQQYDTLMSLITLRDTYMQNTLMAKTVELENEIKKVIEQNQENKPLITGINLQISQCAGGSCTPTSQFNFASYIAGQKLSNISSVEQCGLNRGQQRPQGVSVAENNSVFVEANRTYNPDTADKSLTDSTPLQDRTDYIRYAGCTGNNAISLNIPSQNLSLGPQFCNPDEAYAPVYDMKGAKEINFQLSSVINNKPNSLVDPGERCAVETMSFLQDPPPRNRNFGNAANQFFQSAYVGADLATVINRIYSSMLQNQEFTVNLNDPSGSLNYRLNKIARTLLAQGATGKRSYAVGSGFVELQINSNTQPARSVVSHQEPLDATIQNTCGNQFTQSVPADGIRFIEFYKNNQRQIFEYPNLFRVDGNNSGEINQNLLKLIEKKDAELNQLIGKKVDVIGQFMTTHQNLSEPIVWRQMGIDQKHEAILEKYLNRDSLLPTPLATASAPVNKPKGYEVMHLVAKGDEQQFEFAIHRSQLSDEELVDPELELAKKNLATTSNQASPANSKPPEAIKLFKCGKNDGVEIWEWLPTVIGCWIPEEIGKLNEAISLNNSCSALHLPKVQDQPEDKIYEKFENPLLVSDLELNTPAKLTLDLDQTVIGPDQAIKVGVSVKNNKGDLIWGALDAPIKLSLSNDQLAQITEPSLVVLTGEAQTKLTANKASGKTTINATLGNLKASAELTILDKVHVQLTSIKNTTGQPSYEITAILVDDKSNRITGINTWIELTTDKPNQGIFLNPRLQIQGGAGKTLFFPNPKAEVIGVSAQHSVYTSDQLNLAPIIGDPYQVELKAPLNIGVGENIKIPVQLVDAFGGLVKTIDPAEYTPAVQVKITDKFKDFGQLKEKTILLKNGQGVIELQAGTQTGQLNLIATHPRLKPGIAELPIVAEVKQSEWQSSFPQSLFTSMVGFPAGNFLKENYFGGTHLFTGKTQAVFAFMSDPSRTPALSIEPNYQLNTHGTELEIKLTNLTDQLGLEILNPRPLDSILSGTIPLDFDQIKPWDELADVEPGTLYVELSNDRYRLEEQAGKFDFLTRSSENIATIQANKIQFYDSDYLLKYETDSDFSGMEIAIQNNFKETIGRLRLAFKPRPLKESQFTINASYQTGTRFSGNSHLSATGLNLYQNELTDNELSEDFGFTGDHKYLLRFAGGSPIGEAVQFNMPIQGVLLGDPTIQLKTQRTSSLNYDRTIGRQIFQDPEGADVVSLTHFDFNNDQKEDVAAVMKDGRVRLFEAGDTDPIYKDRGDIAFLADGVLSITAFDFKNDGYDDLVISTREGRLAILNNEREEINRTDQKLKVGQQLYQVSKADMDDDGYDDLITLDSRGDLRIFYNQKKGDSAQGQIPENGTLIENYGFSIKTDDNLKNDLSLRFQGIKEPFIDSAVINSPVVSPTPSASNPYGLPQITPPASPDLSKLENFTSQTNVKSVSANEAIAHVQQSRQNQQQALQSTQAEAVPTLPWADNGKAENYFAKITDFEPALSAVNGGTIFTASKKVINKNRPSEKNLDLNEVLKYTLTVQANQSIADLVLADLVPDSLTLDTQSIDCTGNGCQNFKFQSDGVYLFFSGLNLTSNQNIEISYEATVKHTPKATLMIQKLEGRLKLSATGVAVDRYLDLLVSPPYNRSGQLMVHYSTGARQYKTTTTVKQENPVVATAVSQQDKCLTALQKLQNATAGGAQTPNESLIKEMSAACGIDKVQQSLNECAINPNGNPKALSPQESAFDLTKANQALQNVADSIANFKCTGGGCFPMPFNQTFLAPGTIPYAMPLLSFPATLPTPVGPIPVPTAFASFPTALGATSIPGTYNSLVRTYTMPTLTGGMGIGVCWGPYAGDRPVPPPLVPIPYPPPIGNCITFALPQDALPYGAACKIIEEGITKLMEGANGIVTDLNSGLSAINNGGLPVSVDQGPSQEGAGGIEIGLALNLGNARAFKPPVQNFTNKQAGSYDPIGGLLAKWVDRQKLEITQKLLNLPTIRVIMPDVSGLFAKDWELFSQSVLTWKNSVLSNQKNAQDLGNAFKNIGEADAKNQAGKLSNADAGSLYLENYKAIEQEISNFNTSSLEGLYAIMNAAPLINVQETYIDVRFPYLSYGEIQNLVRDLQQTQLHYQKQRNQYQDAWEKFECPDVNAGECATRRILKNFIVDIDTLIKSIQKNIEVMQLWAKFPRDLSLLHKELADYLYQSSCILDSFSQTMGGWLSTIQNQFIQYAEVYFTIEQVVLNIKKLFNVFTEFESNSNICTNDRHSNFGWFSLLGLVLPDLPIINFPQWPDLVLDFSNIKGEINIELPTFRLIGETVNFPKIPRLELPDLPDVNDLKLLTQIPALPTLPRPPKLPKLPPLPAIPQIKLPTLPPPPKLPNIGAQLDVVIPFVDTILKMWTLIKKSYTPIPEAYLGDHTTLLTNRPAYLIPLDLAKPRVADIAVLETDFNELRIETTIYLGFRLKAVLEDAQKFFEKTWNPVVNKMVNLDQLISDFSQKRTAEFENYLQKNGVDLNEVNQGVGVMLDAIRNYNQLAEDAWEKEVQSRINSNEFTAYLKQSESRFRQNELDWQSEFDKATIVLEEKIQYANQKLVNKFNEFDLIVKTVTNNADIRNAFINLRKTEFLETLRLIGNPALVISDEFIKNESINSDKVTEEFRQILISAQKSAIKLNEIEQELEKLKALENKPDTPQWVKDAIDGMRSAFNEIDETLKNSGAKDAVRGNNIPPNPQAKLPADLEKSIVDEWSKLAQSIESVNEQPAMTHEELLDQFDLPDYQLPIGDTLVDNIQVLRHELLARAEDINNKIEANEGRQDLLAWADEKIEKDLPIRLASNEISDQEPVTVKREFGKLNTTSSNQVAANTGRLIAQANPQSNVNSASQPNHNPSGTASCPGVCLVDPLTGQSVPFISHFDHPALTQTTFVPSSVKGESHVVYSDGKAIYLKRNLAVPISTKNKASRVDNVIFELDQFLLTTQKGTLPKNAIHQLSTTLTENGSAEFNWKAVTHPSAYGYGIQLEKSVLGHKNGQPNYALADVTIILLPSNPDGTTPRVTVGEKVVPYGTLITSLNDEAEAQKRFGITADNTITKANQVLFRTVQDVGINLKPYRAVYFDQYNGPSTRLKMDNGYYHINMAWFDSQGQIANYNQAELLAPQSYIKTAEPIDIAFDKTFQFPVYKPVQLNANELLTDLSGSYQYTWDLNEDGLIDQTGDTLNLSAPTEPQSLKVKLSASVDFKDEKANVYTKTFNVVIYAPQLELDEEILKNDQIAKGSLIPLNPSDDVSDIPFSLLRKRWGVWKNLGLLKRRSNTPTDPELSDKNNWKDNYYSLNTQGDYEIKNFSHGPSTIVIQDQSKTNVARVHAETGQIEIFNQIYSAKAVPASETLPTRIAIIETSSSEILANVYYASDPDTDVSIINGAITQDNLNKIGVQLGDRKLNDSIVAKNLPGFAKSFPGGAVIFNEKTEQNIAMINTDGDLRFMQNGYDLRLKNQGKLDEKIIFEIIDSNLEVIFDLFIATDFNQTTIRPTEVWSELKTMIGRLEKVAQPMFASLVSGKREARSEKREAQPNRSEKTLTAYHLPLTANYLAQATKPNIPTPTSPFSDIKPDDSRFDAILNLYKRRLIEGFSDGTFKPNAKITRAEFVKIALGATNCFDCSTPSEVIKQKYSAINPFPDVSLPAWYHFCISIAKELGMVQGYGDGLFRAEQNISRAEAAAVLLRQSGIPLEKAPNEFFLDVEDFAWYADYAYTAVQIGLIPNQKGFVFPNEEITRGEFAFMADLVLKLKDCRLVDSDQDGMPDGWEADNNLDPLDPSDAPKDNDKDKLTNLEEYKKGTDPNKADDICPYLNGVNQNDTDLDGIIDNCDDDIDNDSIKNLLGIFDINGALDSAKVASSDDNCVFVPNQDQTDSDGDGVGDACKSTDLCPGIPEDLDGVDDQDGCPEVNDKTPKNNPGTYTNKGPLCYFIDYENDLMPGDILMTTITDVNTHEIIYSKSNEVTY